MGRNTILIVDDKDIGRDILAAIFKTDYNILIASDGLEATKLISSEKDRIALIILDIIMPIMDGFGVLDYLRETKLSSVIPVIMVTGQLTPDISLSCYTRGAFDLIEKPYDLSIVKQRVSNAIELYTYKNHLERLVGEQIDKLEKQADELRNIVKELRISEERFRIASIHSSSIIFEFDVTTKKGVILSGSGRFNSDDVEHVSFDSILKRLHPDDKVHVNKTFDNIFSGSDEEHCDIRMRAINGHKDFNWYSATLTPIRSQDGEIIRILGTLRDINTQYLETADLRSRAEVDMMSGLLNRATCENNIRTKLKKLDKAKRSAFMIFDIDDFKSVNDRFGHDTGDRAITVTAHTIRSQFSHSDIVGRFGGDEFVVYLENVPNEELLFRKFNRIQQKLREHAESTDGFPLISISAGASITLGSIPFEQIYKEADTSLYEIKSEGKGRLKCFSGGR